MTSPRGEPLQHLSFGVSLLDASGVMKPRILHFDFLKRIFYIVNKGLVRDAFPFGDILECTVLEQQYYLLIDLRNLVQPIIRLRFCFQSHESRDLIFTLLISLAQTKQLDTYENTVYMSGILEKKGKVKWSHRYTTLIAVKSTNTSVNNYRVVQLLVFKNQKDIFPVNSIEISNPTFDVDTEMGEQHTAFRIRAFFRAFDFRSNSPANSETWVSVLKERMQETNSGSFNRLQPVNVAPESVSLQLDRYKVSFNQLNEILKNEGVDLRTYFIEKDLLSENRPRVESDASNGWRNVIKSPNTTKKEKICSPQRSNTTGSISRSKPANRVQLGSFRGPKTPNRDD